MQNFDGYLDTRNCSCRKRLFGELILAYGDEILNTSETTVKSKTL